MDRQPPETLCNIVSNCNFATQKQLRLVCQELADIASEYVFDTVFLALLGVSHERVLNIANHPKFFRHVRTIIFCPQLLPECKTLNEWESHLNSRPYPKRQLEDELAFADPAIFLEMLQTTELSDWHQWSFEDNEGVNISIEEWIELPGRQLTPSQARAGFNRYVQMYNEQSSWLKTGFTNDMQNLLRNLPNLTEIVLPDPSGLQSLPFWRGLRSELLQSPGEWVQQNEWHPSEWGFEQLTSLLEAAAVEQKALKKLRFNIDAEVFLSNKDNSELVTPRYGLEDARLARMMGAFAHLRELDVDFCRHIAEAGETVARRFASVLGNANQLETLSIVLTQSICHRGVEPGVDFLAFLKPVHLQKLKSLTLSNIRTNQDSLIDLLSTHAATLRVVFLTRINLNWDEGSWTSIITQLPDILSLESVILGSLGEIAKPHGSCYHVENVYHLYDCDGPGWDEYYGAVEMWVLHRDDLDEDDFPILSGHEWNEIFPEDLNLHVHEVGGLASGDSEAEDD